MNLLIGIPSRERALRLNDTIHSILNTAPYQNIPVRIRIDSDEPQVDLYRSTIDQLNDLWNMSMFVGPTGKYIELINELYNISPILHDAFMCGTDDIIFEDKGWFEELEKINAKNKYWVAWFNDEEKLEECAQVPILSKAVIDVLGTPLYPKLGHFYGDLWITIVAKLCGIAHYIPTHRIIHMTPKNGRVKGMDKTFMRVRLNEQVLKDMKILEESSADLTDAVNKIKKAMKDDQSN